MTSAGTALRSFYPLPPSVYPQPLVDPCANFETTYGHNHCAHSVRDSEFFRSRTFNPESTRALSFPQPAANAPLQNAAQGIYPRHGTGQFVIPYYRRDSTGFRRSYTQPVHVDDNYSATADISGLAHSGFQWSHPSSRPTYAASKLNHGTGATFSTSYRNSGLFDATATYTSRPARTVGQGLQYARTARLSGTSALPSVSASASASATTNSIGYYPGEVVDTPPIGSETYESEEQVMSNLEKDKRVTQRAILGDELLTGHLENALRKPRTVYKRSYGKCQ